MSGNNKFRSTPPEVTDFPPLAIQYPIVTSLSNGIKIFIIEAGEQPVNRLTLSWECGMTDVDDTVAMALMAKTLREGSVNYSGKEISEVLDSNGAWLKIDPLSHNFTITLHSLNKTAAAVLPLILDMIENPVFPKIAIETIKEKYAATTEINLKKVATLASIADKRLTFGKNHPLATQNPTPDQIRSITVARIKKVWENTIAKKAPHVFIAGHTTGISAAVNEALVSKAYNNSGVNRRIIPFNPEREASVYVESPDALQSAIYLSIPTIPRNHPDYIDLRLAIMALGGYFGSRLMANIREDKGYTYGINAAQLGYLEGGVTTISCQADPRYVNPLIDEVVKEINTLRDTPMEYDELTSLKRFAMSSLASTLDSPFSIMDHHINHIHVATPENYFELQQKAITQLTPERISEVVAKHLDLSKMKISIAGPNSGHLKK